MLGHSVALLQMLAIVGSVTVRDADDDFSFELADGFSEAPELVTGDVIHAYRLPPQDANGAAVFVFVQRLRGMIPQNTVPNGLPSKVTSYAETWHEHELPVTCVPESHGDSETMTLNVLVPLKPRAIQISLLGETSSQPELQRHLQSILTSLRGESNWMTDEERRQYIAGPLLFIIAVVTVAVYAWRERWRKRRGDNSRESDQPA